MITLTAVIRCKAGSEAMMKEALLKVARHARDEESGTIGYFVTQANEAGTFVTHERYTDQAALDAHNDGPAATAFFAGTKGHIEKADIIVGSEIFATHPNP